MTDLLETVVIPVADEDVAEATARTASDYLADDAEVVLVHVVDETDEFTTAEESRAMADAAFERVRDVLGADRITTAVRSGEDVATTIFEVAAEFDASAIAFRSRGGSRWRQIMAGDVARELVTEAERPVVVLPREE